jgi:homoserine kinase type II
MAVFTDVSPDDARALVAPLSLGKLTALRGITAGIENSNFFLDTDEGHFVLTVFERLSFTQLPFYLSLMHHLAQKGLPVPQPRTSADGTMLFSLHGKPCAVVDKLEGAPILAPNASHVEPLGCTLARMHQAVADFTPDQPNLRSLAWWQSVVPTIRPHLSTQLDGLVSDELAHLQRVMASPMWQALPRGAVHADLFRDNALFTGQVGRERLSGVFDFYFAGVDTFVFDLAVCMNDWCIDDTSGVLDTLRATTLLQAYQSVRRLSPQEQAALPDALRAAAYRFWVSRLWDWHLPRQAQMLKAHDPTHFERVLRARRSDAQHGRRLV